jgi:hypothetical protein
MFWNAALSKGKIQNKIFLKFGFYQKRIIHITHFNWLRKMCFFLELHLF